MGVLPKLFKLSSLFDLDPFYAKVKFGHIGFWMGKSENYLFFGNYCRLRSQSCLKHLVKWVNDVEWVSKVNRPIDRWPWNFVCSIFYASTTKIVQIITLKSLPWVDLDTFYAKVKFGDWEKVKIIYFFGNCCSLKSQSCMKHSSKWVNEVEWVSKVKVILWPWSKVTQISKLNVWLLAWILRWAIQGLLALLFIILRGLWGIFTFWHTVFILFPCKNFENKKKSYLLSLFWNSM